MKYCLLLIFILWLNPLPAKQADYFLFSTDGSAVILNKYEQRLTYPILPGTPFQLVQKDIILSDGITKAHKLLFNNDFFFLLPGLPELNLIPDCTVIEDTVELTNAKNQLQQLDGSISVLEKGSSVQRIFHKGNRTYISSGAFGWCRLPANSWKSVNEKTIKEAEGLPDNLRQRILGQMETVNQKYKEFYDHFNKKHNQAIPVPRWEFYTDEKSHMYYLKNIAGAPILAKSNTAFMNELGRILTGSRFACEQSGNQLIISTNR